MKGVKKGSQKRIKHPFGTDKPDQYVGKWEAYDKPQGINETRYRVVWRQRDSTQPSGYAEGSLIFDAKNEKEARAKAKKEYPFSYHLPGFGSPPKIAYVVEISEALGRHVAPPVEESDLGLGTTRFGPPQDTPIGDLEHVTDFKAIKQSIKAPLKKVKKSVKALFGTSTPLVREYRVYEHIRKPIYGTLNGEYEVQKDEKPVGSARVEDGVIDDLQFNGEADEKFRGEIVCAILQSIISDADRINANLSIELKSRQSEFKTYLERFGFRLFGGTVLKRAAGSIRPTSVAMTPGLGSTKTD